LGDFLPIFSHGKDLYYFYEEWVGPFFTNSSGTDVMIFKIFSPKNSAKKIGVVDSKQS
jgi:hypothetical protein